MTRRSRAREVVLQLLFQLDQNPKPIPRTAIEDFAQERLRSDADSVTFALDLYDNVLARQADIDKRITATAENWRLHRMLPVDRNLLRIGTYEIAFAEKPTPVAVAIDEVIELSRRFGSAESPSFVNGILDKIAKSQTPSAPANANATT